MIHFSQAAADGAASTEERAELLHKALAAHPSSYHATDQLKESDDAQETRPSDTVLPVKG